MPKKKQKTTMEKIIELIKKTVQTVKEYFQNGATNKKLRLEIRGYKSGSSRMKKTIKELKKELKIYITSHDDVLKKLHDSSQKIKKLEDLNETLEDERDEAVKELAKYVIEKEEEKTERPEATSDAKF